MLKFNPSMAVSFYAESSVYIPGQGHTTAWTKIESVITPETEDIPAEKTGVFYCEWKGAFGERLTAAQAIGVSDSATIRMTYNPDVYEKLRSAQVLIAKQADETTFNAGTPAKNNPNLYELWSGVENVGEVNQFMEFRVRRYEGK